jgi:hypothetical protein
VPQCRRFTSWRSAILRWHQIHSTQGLTVDSGRARGHGRDAAKIRRRRLTAKAQSSLASPGNPGSPARKESNSERVQFDRLDLRVHIVLMADSAFGLRTPSGASGTLSEFGRLVFRDPGFADKSANPGLWQLNPCGVFCPLQLVISLAATFIMRLGVGKAYPRAYTCGVISQDCKN